ncbi:MAG: orotate phosphoribosyltransferase [Hyphomicrobiaceae bacterium]
MKDRETEREDDRGRLIEIVRQRSFRAGVETKLASGRRSTFYFNMKPTMLNPEGAFLIGGLICDAIRDDRAEFIGGLEMGAVPIATAVAVVSHSRGVSLPAFIVRKRAKDHGTQALIEGLSDNESIAGRATVIVEDVTTTGGSALNAVETVRAAGGEILRVVTVVDRREGATAAFQSAGVPFSSLLSIDDFVE